MSVRLHGGMTVAHARREGFADEIASRTGLGVRAVRNRLDRVHGKTHLRVAFPEWPPRQIELAELTTAAALEMDLARDIAEIVDLTPRQVRGRLNRVAHGKTLVGTVFAYEWPDEFFAGDGEEDGEKHGEEDGEEDGEETGEGSDASVDLEAVSVADARRFDLAGEIADRTGLGVRKVRARLRAAHGNALLVNLFADEWDAGSDEVGVTGTRVIGSSPGRGPTVGSLVSGRYRLLRPLGKGGQGEAFEAEDEQLPQRGLVVLKFAPFDTAAREFTIAMKFRHDNICQYFDTSSDDRGRQYLVIEHGGRSLAQLIDEEGAQTRDRAFEIIAPAAAALDYAHAKGVIHHDVSPGNILIDDEGHVRVTDFGVSVAGTMRAIGGRSQTMVAATLIGLNPAYSAPEMRTSEPVRARADQYSLALVLCSLLEGEVFTKPYRPRNFQRLTSAQNSALRRALAQSAADRFA